MATTIAEVPAPQAHAHKPPFAVSPGRAHPLGATVDSTGVNFSIFSHHGTGVELLLFDAHDSPDPVQVIRLDPSVNRTFHFWHVHVDGLRPGMHYAYRVDGPWDLAAGHRFNRNKLLVDPYARGNTDNVWVRGDACGADDNLRTSLRSVVVSNGHFAWEGDRPLKRPMSETVIYEMHVGGFTRSPTSGVASPGTFAGIIEKIPYLQSLGVTAVELMPIHQFDAKTALRTGPDGQPLPNYWGYSTIAFFSPHPGYCTAPQEGKHSTEFREMVKALHRAGMEVILDVVFNHTDEGNQQGPTLSFRGLDNSLYYHLVAGDKQYYMDYSGCGNTVNCNHPIVEKLIVDCLEYWVREMHVDGFRFDEGSILARDQSGVPVPYPPVIWEIELSETLADTKIIAEAWDAAGLYQIGYFPGYRWAEWNGRFRDDVRRFVRGDPGIVGAVASRIAGSSDIYESTGHLPINSVNFVTAHDGFTLNDLVSYDGKHNEGNGEGNRDGVNENLSWNCGVEGESGDVAIESLRARQVRNFATILLLSQGVPMFVMGDEARRTQRGNNNAYCQDNETSWLDWKRVEENADLVRFFSRMIEFRRTHPTVHRPRFFTGAVNERGLKDVAWHGCRLDEPNWADPDARVLAFTLGGTGAEADLHVMMNMYWEPLVFDVPAVPGRTWRRVVDTSLPSPDDIAEDQAAGPSLASATYEVGGRSIVVLAADGRGGATTLARAGT